MTLLFIEAILLLALIGIAIVIIMDTRLFTAAVSYGAFSFFAVLLYIAVGAADVAFTEAVIGSISTVYFVFVIKTLDMAKKGELPHDR